MPFQPRNPKPLGSANVFMLPQLPTSPPPAGGVGTAPPPPPVGGPVAASLAYREPGDDVGSFRGSIEQVNGATIAYREPTDDAFSASATVAAGVSCADGPVTDVYSFQMRTNYAEDQGVGSPGIYPLTTFPEPDPTDLVLFDASFESLPSGTTVSLTFSGNFGLGVLIGLEAGETASQLDVWNGDFYGDAVSCRVLTSFGREYLCFLSGQGPAGFATVTRIDSRCGTGSSPSYGPAEDTYFGERDVPSTAVNGAAADAKTAFLGNVGNVGTLTFESVALTSPSDPISGAAFSAPRTDVVASIIGDALYQVINAPAGGSTGRFNTTTPGVAGRILTTDGAITILLNKPVYGIGFYGTDVGDFESQIYVRVAYARGPAVEFMPLHGFGVDSNLVFWGHHSPKGIVSLRIRVDPGFVDTIGIDDIVVGDAP